MQFPDLKYDIHKKAFAVFRGWTAKAKQRYPTLEISVENEQGIVNEFQEAIMKGLESISEKDDSETHYYWCIGFLKGYLISTLSIAWSQKYLLKPRRYNNILWLKAIILYLSADELTLKRINRLYRYLLETEFPFKKLEKRVVIFFS